MNWRTIGDTTYEAWTAEINARAPSSPILNEGRAAYEAARPHSRLCLGMMWIEDRFQTDPSTANLPSNFNCMNMKTPDGAGWMEFDSWADGIKGWVDRITSPTYKPQNPGVYAKTTTVNELVHVYAPANDNNDEANYVATIGIIVGELMTLERQLGGSTPSTTTTPAPTQPGGDTMTYKGPTIPVYWRPIPAGAVNNPDGLLLPGNLIIVWHENGNPDSDAEDEAGFVLGGGGKDRVSYSFAVDHEKAYQFFALNELCWHAADGCDNPATDRGCFRGVPIEHCQDRDPGKWAATKRNGAILTAMIIGGHPSIHFGGREGDFSADRIETHRAVSDTKKWCPEFMLNEGSVPDQIALVKSFLAIGQDDEPTKPTEPDYADRITTGFNGKDTTVKRKVTIKTGEKDANGKALTEEIDVVFDVWELVRSFEVVPKTTKRRQGPNSRDPIVGPPLVRNEQFTSRYLAVPRKQVGKDIPAETFVVTEIATWVQSNHLHPRVSIRKA